MNCGIFWRISLAALLVPGSYFARAAETATIRGANTLVRSLPTRFSPSIAKLQPGEVILLQEEVMLEKPTAGDELHWLKITCPTNASAWVSALFVDTNLNTVSSTRLNVRAGPSENYPTIGRVPRGYAITNLGVKGDWIQIPPPADAFGFVAASLVNLPQKAETETPLPVTITNVPPVEITETATASNPPVAVPAIETTNQAAVVPTVITSAPPDAVSEPTPAPPITVVTITEPPKPRGVTREGWVSGITSIQAPSHFKLENLQTRQIMDYLYSPTTNLVLNRYVGRRVIVSGEEALDKRWPTTPVITIQRIQVVEE
jgi:hypothetical protein